MRPRNLEEEWGDGEPETSSRRRTPRRSTRRPMGTTKVSLLTTAHHLRRQCNIRVSPDLANRDNEDKI
jgi:hypothetical protein